MKRNITLIFLALAAAAVAGYSLLISDRTGKGKQEAPAALSSREAPLIHDHEVSEDKKRITAMRAAYAELEQTRDVVRRQLGKLKSKLWKLQISPEQTRAIRAQMYQGYAILKNPPLLGAFSSVTEIRQELARVSGIANKLSGLEVTVQEYSTAQETR